MTLQRGRKRGSAALVMDASTGRAPMLIRKECIDSFHSGGLGGWAGISLDGGRGLQQGERERRG